MSGLDLALRRSLLAGLARPTGGFAMVALDQRGSLEAMMRSQGRVSDDAAIDGFREAAVQALTPYASAILLERGFLVRTRGSGQWTGPCGLIVAADELVQPPDMPVEASRLDPAGADLGVAIGAQALKLLVLWFAGEPNDEPSALVDTFVELAHAHGLLALVEGLVRDERGPQGRRATGDDLLAAAARFSAGADVYKAQVPIHGGDAPGDVERLSREITATIACPWVVLSTGVSPDRFAALVAAACRGGASGFLAGRAVWGPSLADRDPPAHLAGPAAEGLRRLAEIVDAEARPWSEVA